jgi:predicted RecA/RadA family phage recombinase
MSVKFYKGESLAVDYTPLSAVSGGDAVIRGGNVFFAKSDIPALALGALDIGGQWKAPKAAGGGSGWSDGDVLYWDASGARLTATPGLNKKVGIAVGDAADADTEATVLSVLNVDVPDVES